MVILCEIEVKKSCFIGEAMSKSDRLEKKKAGYTQYASWKIASLDLNEIKELTKQNASGSEFQSFTPAIKKPDSQAVFGCMAHGWITASTIRVQDLRCRHGTNIG